MPKRTVAKRREKSRKQKKKRERNTFLSECSSEKKSFMFKMILSLFEGESSNTQTHIEKKNNGSGSDYGNSSRNGAKKELWHRLSLLFLRAPRKLLILLLLLLLRCEREKRTQKTLLNPLLRSFPSILFIFVIFILLFFESRLLFFNLLSKKLVVLSCFMQSHSFPLSLLTMDGW